MKLKDREWKAFKIQEIFDVSKGIYLHRDNIKEGDIPYVSAKANNNGIIDFIGNDKLFSANKITIEKVKFSSFYQNYEFYCSHDVSVLDNKNIDRYTALFICTMLKKQGNKYSYGRQAQMNVVKRESVFLPVNIDEEPDYEFMREYIKEIQQRKKEQYLNYCSKILNEFKTSEIPELEEKNWNEFFIVDLFPSIQRGKRLIREKQIEGNIPYVSSSGVNNAVDAFIGNKDNVRKFRKCLSLANSGSVGSCFYEPFTFIASDHITHLKNDKYNKYIYMFLSTIISRIGEKYNFNREINDNRISREKIFLPINEKGEPDFEYMEQYVKNILYNKIDEYKRYMTKDEKIELMVAEEVESYIINKK